MLLFLLLNLVDPAYAAPPADVPTGTSSQQANQDPSTMLEDAKNTYLLGQHEAASELLRRIVLQSEVYEVPFEIKATALAYLGEIAFAAGRDEEAKLTFRRILQEDISWKLSQVDHPRDVVGLFEIVRSEVIEYKEFSDPDVPPYPFWGYAPFGIPQFGQGKKARGALYATLQGAFAATSIVAVVLTDQARRRQEEQLFVDQQEAFERARLLRDTMSIPSAAAFYVTWIISVADGGMSWRKRHVAPPVISVAPTLGGAEVQVGFTF